MSVVISVSLLFKIKCVLLLPADFEDPSAGKIAEVNGVDGLGKEAETSTGRLPLTMSDDEPLSMWLEPPKTANAIGKLVS